MRGEVGVLSHNVRVTGSMVSDADTWGGHVHVTGPSSVQIDVRIFPSFDVVSSSHRGDLERRVLFHRTDLEQRSREIPLVHIL